MLSGFYPARFGVLSAVWCSAGDTRLKLLNRVVSAARFLTRGVFECDIALWHMPHGIIFLTSLKSNNNCYLLFEQPSSCHFHATPCVSSYLSSPSHDRFASTKSTHCHFSPRSEGLMPLLALLISIRDALLTTYTLLSIHLSLDSHHEYLKLSYSSF